MCSLFHLHRKRGWKLYHKDKFEEAIAQWRVAAELDPEDGYVLSSIGQALSEMGRKDEAIAEWRQAVRLEPDYDKPHVRLAYALSAKGYSLEALAAVQAAIHLKFDDVNLYNFLSYHLMVQAEETGDKADWEKAIVPLKQSIALDPTDAYAGQHLAQIQWFLGEKREAVATMNAVISADPNNFEVHKQLGGYQVGTGDIQGAIRTVQAMYALPENEEVKQYLDNNDRIAKRVVVSFYVSAGLTAVLVGVWIWNRRRGK